MVHRPLSILLGDDEAEGGEDVVSNFLSPSRDESFDDVVANFMGVLMSGSVRLPGRGRSGGLLPVVIERIKER